jgi:hypothetical protein
LLELEAMSLARRVSPVFLAVTALATACSAQSVEEGAAGDDAITSKDGAVLEFRFSGEVEADGTTPARQAVVSQLQYLQGILTTAERANAQVGLVELSGVRETPRGDKKTVAYTASLPVVWPKDSPRPPRYDLPLPRDITALDAFNAKYDGRCGTNEYGQETFWHDYDPNAVDCTVDDADVQRAQATVRPHPKTTTGKYPEYDRIWSDDALDIVAVFGIITSNTPEDEGAREMESVVRDISATLTDARRVDNAPSASIIKDATVTGSISVGGQSRRVTLNAMLVQEVSTAGSDFDARFGAASESADFVVYSGHSGLGANIDGLAEKSRVKRGKYQLVYLNGCQTFAYLGTTWRDKHITANGRSADPNGTKDMDVVANALPAYGDNGSTMLTLYNAIIGYRRTAKTYNQLLESFSSSHLVAVFGEDDNAFNP